MIARKWKESCMISLIKVEIIEKISSKSFLKFYLIFQMFKIPCSNRKTFKDYLIEKGVDAELRRVIDKLKTENPLPDDPWKYIGLIFDSVNKKELSEVEKEKVLAVKNENKQIEIEIEKQEKYIEELESKIEVELKRLNLL